MLSRALLLALTLALALVRHRSPLALWNVLDARWYTGIALHGYGWSLDGKPALAFFPLFPALLHLVIRLGVAPVLGAMLLANVLALGALLYVRALLAAEWGATAARGGIWLLALFPTAFFTFAPYTESLFLLAAAAVLYHAPRGEIVRAGLWFAVAVLTRSTGCILFLPLLMSVLWGRRRGYAFAFLPAACAVAGYAGYLLWQHLPIQQVVGSEERWHRSLTFPWNGFTSSLHYLAYHFTYNAGWTAENLLALGVTAFFLALTAAAWRSLPPPIAIYCLGFWIVVLCTPEWRDGYFAPFSSVDRFVLALFPLAGWVAGGVSAARLRLWLWCSGALMTAAAALHLSGGWVG